MVGLNFANEREALQFSKAVDSKVNERQEKRASELDISCMYIYIYTCIRFEQSKVSCSLHVIIVMCMCFSRINIISYWFFVGVGGIRLIPILQYFSQCTH